MSLDIIGKNEMVALILTGIPAGGKWEVFWYACNMYNFSQIIVTQRP